MYFEKRANLWEVEDIAQLAGAAEGIYLEFKKPSEFIRNGVFSRDLVAQELAETISAFLNSDGGVILIGVQTDKPNKDKKIEILKPLDSWLLDHSFEHLGIELTASQIQDLVSGNVVPKPMGVEVKSLQVLVGEEKTTVFIVTVSASPLGAHQSAKTWRYYRRTTDGDEPMLDFEIRDVNNRRAGPLLYLACKVSSIEGNPYAEEWRKSSSVMEPGGSGDAEFYRINIIFAVSNSGRGTAEVVRFDVGIPSPWFVQHYSPDGTNVGAYWESKAGLQYYMDSLVTIFWRADKCQEIPHPYRNQRLSEREVMWQEVIYPGNIPPAHPIWPDSGHRIIGVLRLQRNKNAGEIPFLWLPWRAFSNEMSETRGAALLKENGNRSRVFNYEMEDVSWWHHAEEEAKFEELKQRFEIH